MDFDWLNSPALDSGILPREIEESFEDAFSIRILPDHSKTRESRYYILGRAISGHGLFSVFWTDGKTYRVIFSREMTEDETAFYERNNSEVA